MIHKKIWLLQKKNTTRTFPDVHFLLGPLVADTISPLNKETHTKTRLTVFERMILRRPCLVQWQGGGGRLWRLRWVRSAPSLSRDTGAALPFSLPEMRSRTAASFNYLSPSQIVSIFFSLWKCAWDFFFLKPGWIYSESVREAGGAADALQGQGCFFFVRAALRPLFVCVGPAPVRPVCALSAVLSACLSVCLVGCLAVCLPVSYN